MKKKLKFRPDIEGLRGVAVSLVLLFHFDVLFVNAGHIGVDVFFVISGFLVTQIITSDKFRWDVPSSLRNFYISRFWRIVPSYYIVLSVVAFLFILLPWSFKLDQLSKSLFYSSIFSYNIIAPSDTDYFGAEALGNPVLHLWSLGAEVQFYLLWPVIIYFIRRFCLRSKLLVIGVLVAISFIASLILVEKDPGVAYYSILTRLWQFGIGSICAFILKSGYSFSSTTLKNFALFMLLSFAQLVAPQSWPGVGALLVTFLSAILLITVSNRGQFDILNFSLLRFLGRISYSLYLVHWPVVVFANLLLSSFSVSIVTRIIALCSCVFLASVLTFLVEDKFRQKNYSMKWSKYIFGAYSSSSFFLIFFLFLGGYPTNFLPKNYVAANEVESEYYTGFGDICEKTKRDLFCKIGDDTKLSQVLIWGDSHARHFSFGFHDQLRSEDASALLFNVGGCLPIPEFYRVNHGARERCAMMNQAVLKALQENDTIKTVVLSAAWANYIKDMDKIRSKSNGEKVNENSYFKAIARVTKKLSGIGKEVIIVAQAPSFAEFRKVNKCRMDFMQDVIESDCAINEGDGLLHQIEVDRNIHSVTVELENVSIFNPKDVLCEGRECIISDNQGFFYIDKGHLSPYGARFVLKNGKFSFGALSE